MYLQIFKKSESGSKETWDLMKLFIGNVNASEGEGTENEEMKGNSTVNKSRKEGGRINMRNKRVSLVLETKQSSEFNS